MNVDFHYREKIPVAILGATGAVGQHFVELLAEHPWFQIEVVTASEKSSGKKYADAVSWGMNSPLPKEVGELVVQQFSTDLPVSLCFSALDPISAAEQEEKLARAGLAVVTNASPNRMKSSVPLVVPEVNPEAYKTLPKQGYIVANPNCVVAGLTLALKPLADAYGLEALQISTMQALSGAGAAAQEIDIEDNVIPWIRGEEEKVEEEPKKILSLPELKVSAQCNRVNVTDGHLENVAVRLKSKATKEEIIELWNSFQGVPQGENLPSAPKQPLVYLYEEDAPQPKKERLREKGMAVTIGRLRECPVLDWKFSLLSHNRVRGAAGCAILNAEMLVKQGLLFW